MLVEAKLLPTSRCAKPRNLQVEEVLGRVIIELITQVTLAILYLDERVLALICVPILKCVHQFANAVLQVDIRWQSHDLNVHVCSFLEFERTVPFEQKIVHTLCVQDIIDQEVAKLHKFLLKSLR